MNFIPEDIRAYIDAHSEKEPEILAGLNRDTHLKALYPRMLSGNYQGRFLAMFSKLTKPKRILEIGTFTGYSCLCLAEGLQENGTITSIELDPEKASIIEPWLEKAGIRHKVNLLFGRAIDILPKLNGPFDIVFIDADKQNYLAYYKEILPKTQKNGLILVDNVLWGGKVLSETDESKETKGIREFNTFIAKDSRVEKILLPIRDGIMMIRKLN